MRDTVFTKKLDNSQFVVPKSRASKCKNVNLIDFNVEIETFAILLEYLHVQFQ